MSLVQQRRKTRQIHIGNVKIGSDAQVSVQSMTNTDTRDVAATINQIQALERAGCEIIRLAVPDMDAALAIGKIKKQITIPLIADIHFDYRLALASAEAGADALRINPGNIGTQDKVKQVVACAVDHDIPIRIGVNAGSLEKEIEQRLGTTAEAMVESALRNIQILEDLNFDQIKVSLKASDVERTVTAYRLLAKKNRCSVSHRRDRSRRPDCRNHKISHRDRHAPGRRPGRYTEGVAHSGPGGGNPDRV